MTPHAPAIAGYTYGGPEVARSPLSDADFALLQRTVLFGDEDRAALRMAAEVVGPQVEDVLDVWYGFVGSSPHLVHYFAGRDGAPDAAYLGAVRRRFGQWIRDTLAADYDRRWLDYQYEVGLRHTRHKKNQTDGVAAAADVIHLRYLIAFIVPLTVTMRPFLAKGGHGPDQVERMQQAWFKAVTLTAVLWSQPYLQPQDF
ncbi:protoglobin domain-containing protein [Pseudorhodoferax sp.]|uniref:protoglobin domain-containing protein n=1 Tax=Pseudorhodoferax sp. TaxID=1993553 RepID=UPI002DD63FA5|nr:protoglobin domain-containing protein [Pseudorhodoferax sp.]